MSKAEICGQGNGACQSYLLAQKDDGAIRQFIDCTRLWTSTSGALKHSA
jgi:hypothetical protein